MALPAIIAGITAGVGAASSIAGLLGLSDAADTAAEAQRFAGLAARESKKIEKLRRDQMRLEGQRRIRQEVRQMIVARSVALSNATNQGAGQSSSLQGGFAQIMAEGFSNIRDINQNLEIGENIFKHGFKQTNFLTQANRLTSESQGQAAMGGSLLNLGISLIGNSTTIGNVGASLFSSGNEPTGV